MRIRASLAAAAFSGAAALTALAVPAAHAGENPAATKAEQFKSAHQAPSKQRSFAASSAAEADGDIQVTKVTVNANKDVVVGLSPKSFNVYVTVTDPSGVNAEQHGVDVALWHGTDPDPETGDLDGFLWNENGAESCDYWSATAATCKFTITAKPGEADGLWDSSLNGKWNVTVFASANDGDTYTNDFYKNHWIKRASSFSGFNAGPEPVAKGKTITISGTLKRASWSYMKYYGYGSQYVELQFKKAGTSTYSTVKTVKTSSSGYAQTTVTASAAGTWRFHYAGNSTSSVADAYDYVDVR
ncbi:calcium-binding protein [Streptomyces sp. NPDC059680]|uniref:calcium-binding protein n=1 Tax=Streptomyces sp. NPDC059680 TaxID=3346904 RepID=UPI0036A92B65